ncbi:nickel/cobalt ABC transporter permease [Staphylococcus edaphicus]|uniref:ABC transporter permease n=1 Tax=Staphylococcus edaphicus TaxID=1955013 RepID=A0A2C6WPS1_9STAP|nr:nickel/cobalt ABC transporter permease [Staphylococcus edaphicus]PHK50133.1 nickel ABC transporter permease subunit NikB [Staphylococcus edaphicus]UQW81631.1 ABC transporter permease [Staphylococcus edaphicus]
MTTFIFKRILFMFPLLIAVSFITFGLSFITNENPAIAVLHAQGAPNITPQLIDEINAQYGFDQSLLIQYGHWLVQALQLNFGNSYITGDSVAERIAPAFINTLKLTVVSSVTIIVTSVSLGIISAYTAGRRTDRVIRGIAFFVMALPSYWVASMFIIYFSVKLNLLPTSGLSGVESYILPVLIMTMSYAGIYFRNVRSAMIEQLNKDYVVYLKACGVKSSTVLWHILRNAMQVTVSIFCMAIPMIMAGIVVIEYMFAWPGLGQLSLKAILEKDFPVIQAYVLIVAVLFIVFNTLADVINGWLNPRLRKGHVQ